MDEHMPESSGLDTLVAELAALLDRMRQLRAQLAGYGVPLPPALAETDRALAIGDQLLALVEEEARPPECR